MNRQIFTIILVVITVLFTGMFPEKSLAVSAIPSFPSCLNPQGQQIVSYDSGSHGIVGQGEVSGTDAVYSISNGTKELLTQCLCQVNGSGMQTNWWKISSLTDEELTELKLAGWQYVPDGSLWGLDPAPYLAQNTSFSCQGGSSDNNNSNSSSGGSSSSSSSSVLGVTQAVLGLAFTGNILFLYSLILTGIVFTGMGIFVGRKQKEH